MSQQKRIKAIAMISSGLDSMLAAKIVHDLGVDVTGLHCVFRFDPTKSENRQEYMDTLFEPVGIPILVKDVTDDFLKMVLEPEHGYGKGVNPCIDCKIFMFSFARRIMDELGVDFLITGEVVGQRPMSQMKPTLMHIQKEAGLKGRILRPLSAQCLPPSEPEEKGWVDRNKLYAINGRSRKEQIVMAQAFGITQFNQPAGGCILTDPKYSKRAKALFDRREKANITAEDMQLLRLGRHFWTEHDLHIVVGRHEEDNNFLEHYRNGRWCFEALDFNGPLVIVENLKSESDLKIAAEITARFTGVHKAASFRIGYQGPDGEGHVTVIPAKDEVFKSWMV